jgi:hypothetical protein
VGIDPPAGADVGTAAAHPPRSSTARTAH